MSKVIETMDTDESDAKGGFRETISTILWALGIAFVLRTFVFQPFHIPSGSMVPGLVKGDYIITSKYSVGYGRHAATPFPFPVRKGRIFERELERGDVIVFRPAGYDKDFIKRVIGLPGDQIQMKNGLLHINGKPVGIEIDGTHQYSNARTGELQLETFSNGNVHQVLNLQKGDRLDNTKPFPVPSGYYFMMGDNRDDSLDSRLTFDEGGVGMVPKENIIGKAEIVLLSVNDDFVIFKPWTWSNMRSDRWFKDIK